jgi:putative transposase
VPTLPVSYITEVFAPYRYDRYVPTGLKRYQQAGHLHFVTFSCYRRQPLLTPEVRDLFESALEVTRRNYRFFMVGYVVMPEHVHLLVGKPERSVLATAIQAMRQSVARRMHLKNVDSFWQARYHDFNVFSDRKRIEKLRYMHRNPVVRGLLTAPQDWRWSSYLAYADGSQLTVQVETNWMAHERRHERISLNANVKASPWWSGPSNRS